MPPPLRVLVATDQWHPDLMGGVARVAAETARRWARAGHAVTVVAPVHPGEPASTVGEDGRLEVLRTLPRGRVPMTLADPIATRRRANVLAGRGGFDVAVAHNATTAAGLLGSRIDAPLLYVFHADPAAEARFVRETTTGRDRLAALLFERPLRVATRRALRRAAAVAVLSEYSRSLVERYEPAAAAAALLVGGGVDTEAFRPDGRSEARDRLGIDAATRLVLTVRRLVPRMGLENLLDAAAQLTEVDGLAVVVAGVGRLGGELERRRTALGLGERLRLVGRVPDDELALWYRAADVFVLPTVAYEGFGLVTAEALASGTPVVATPVAANPEVLGPLDPTLLTVDASAAAIAAGIRSALGRATPALRAACRDYAVRRFSWETALESWTDALERTAHTGRGRS